MNQKQIYCVKERKFTDSINPQYVTAKNGRVMLRAQCASCGNIKTQFVKCSGVAKLTGGAAKLAGEAAKRRQAIGDQDSLIGGAFDIHKAMLPLLPKKGLTPPGYNYFWPGNLLDNGPPVYELDAVCMDHDFCYGSGVKRGTCDKQMLSNLKNTKSKTFGEKIAKHLVVKPAIKTKYKLGLGQKHKTKNQKRG